MIRSTIFLLVALFGVSAVLGAYPQQLRSTLTYQERAHRFAALEKCEKHAVATDQTFTNFLALDLPKNDTRSFRFYTIAEYRVYFALTEAPDAKQNFYAADFLTFDIQMNSTTVKSSKSTQTLKTTPMLLQNQPNEIAVYLGDGGAVNIFVNGFKQSIKIALEENKKSLRYVSFAASPSYYDSQEFFYDCAIHNQETAHMETWDPKTVQTKSIP